MQQTQQNCWMTVRRWLILLVIAIAATPGVAASAPKPDPLLSEATGPCDPRLERPDYVAGADADGNPVAPADLSGNKIPAPKGILLPLAGQSGPRGRSQAYAELDQKDVDSILNPKPACPPARKAR
jgi:hypothetical protein